jgi:hypothetical protein
VALFGLFMAHVTVPRRGGRRWLSPAMTYDGAALADLRGGARTGSTGRATEQGVSNR